LQLGGQKTEQRPQVRAGMSTVLLVDLMVHGRYCLDPLEVWLAMR